MWKRNGVSNKKVSIVNNNSNKLKYRLLASSDVYVFMSPHCLPSIRSRWNYTLEFFCQQTLEIVIILSRSTRPEVFCKNGVLRNFCQISKKTPVLESLFDNVACCCPKTFFKRASAQAITCKIWKKIKNTYFVEYLQKSDVAVI